MPDHPSIPPRAYQEAQRDRCLGMAKKKTTKKQTSEKKSPKKRFAPNFELFKKILLNNPSVSPTEVAMQTYNCKDRHVARVIASQNLLKLNITMADLMARAGMSDEQDLEDLKRLRSAEKLHLCDIHIKKEKGKYVVNQNSNDFMDVPDNLVRLKALELTQKIKGTIKNNVDVSGKVKHDHFIAEMVKKASKIKD